MLTARFALEIAQINKTLWKLKMLKMELETKGHPTIGSMSISKPSLQRACND
jgi:hypothetical protein